MLLDRPHFALSGVNWPTTEAIPSKALEVSGVLLTNPEDGHLDPLVVGGSGFVWCDSAHGEWIDTVFRRWGGSLEEWICCRPSKMCR